VLIDTARSKFAIAGGVMGFQKATDDDEKEKKRQIREKWLELKREPAFNESLKPAVTPSDN
jgi:hypothetical protein